MVNGVVVQFAVFSLAAVILICMIIVLKRPKKQPEPFRIAPPIRPVLEKSQTMQSKPTQIAASRNEPLETEPEPPQTIAMKPASTLAQEQRTMQSPVSSEAPKPTAVIDVQGMLMTQEDKNKRILAGISENIRKNLQNRPVPPNSPILYSESSPRNTEYVRVKKEIITPHGHIRFSILKDWLTINMLAVFRRASLDWKTPDDLIAFLPAYLEPEAEIINGQVLVIGTPGHNEKLAVPIRSLDAASGLCQCFDFITDVRKANTPAVLLISDADFKVVSRGVIAQSSFMNAIEQGQTAVKRLGERSAAGQPQKSRSDALRRMESTMVVDALS